MQYSKQDYKKTSIGYIPTDWEVKAIKDNFKRITTKNNGVSTKVLTISSQYGLVDQEEFFNKQIASKNIDGYYLLQRGNFAYNKSYSNGYPVGAIKRLDRYKDGVVSTLYICFKIDSNDLSSDYYKYYFESETMFNEIGTIAQEGARNHGLLNVNVGEFFNLEIPSPPLTEQQKIADILSTVDEQIDNVDQLIEKTKELKKGLMQQLLTKGIGHTEFKETEVGVIPKEWEVKKFQDICRINQGLQIAIENRVKEYNGNRLPYITLQYLNDKNNIENTFYIENANDSVICNEDDILVTRTGNTGIIVTDIKGVFHNNFFKVNFERDLLNKHFLYYYLKSTYIQKLIMSYAGTTTIPDLKHADFYRLPVLLPSKVEQKKIADILLNIDDKLSDQTQKKNKLQELKKGLMQQLLTGKIRVKVD